MKKLTTLKDVIKMESEVCYDFSRLIVLRIGKLVPTGVYYILAPILFVGFACLQPLLALNDCWEWFINKERLIKEVNSRRVLVNQQLEDEGLL